MMTLPWVFKIRCPGTEYNKGGVWRIANGHRKSPEIAVEFPAEGIESNTFAFPFIKEQEILFFITSTPLVIQYLLHVILNIFKKQSNFYYILLIYLKNNVI